VVAGDAGGASAVVPVVEILLSQPGYRVHSLLYREAQRVWAGRGLPFEPLKESTATQDATQMLTESRADLLLTGTSFNGIDLEKKFIAAARKLGVPSLAVLDFWSNYALRFSDPEGTLVHLPDRIAVMDARALDEMVAAGFDARQLVITGQPALDDLIRYKETHTDERRATLRAALGIQDEDRLVLFASQPLAAVFGDSSESPLYLGYTEITVLDVLVRSLESIARRHAQRINLIIRPHPREREQSFELRSDSIRILVKSDGDSRELVLASDLVTGMTTMLLVESCFLGVPVVSLQPGLRTTDPLPTNRTGLSRPVYSTSEFEPGIEDLLFDESVRQKAIASLAQSGPPGGGAEHVARVIGSML
jgi:hypothetical protein